MANHARVSSQQHYERQAPATLLNAPIRATLLPAPEVAGAGVRLAKAALEAGGRVLDVAAREYERDETTRVEESLLAMRRELSEERDRYMREHQGQDALKAGEHFDGFARDVARRYLSEGKFQGRFAEAFMKQAAGQAIQFTEQGMGYAAREREAWNKSVLDGKVSEFLRDAALDFRNIPRLQEEWRNLKDAVGKMRPGMDNTAYLNDIGRRLAGSVIDGHLAEDDLRGARESVERFRDFLGADANAYAVKIRGQADALQAKAEAQRKKALDKEIQTMSNALVRAVQLLPQEDVAGREHLLVEMATQIQDPELRDKVLAEANRKISFNRRLFEARQDAVTAEFNTPQVRSMSPAERTARLNQYLDEGRITQQTYDSLNKSINGGPTFTVPSVFNTFMDMATGARDDGTPWFRTETELRAAMTEAGTVSLADQDKIIRSWKETRKAESDAALAKEKAEATAYKDARDAFLKNLEALGVDGDKTYHARVYFLDRFDEFKAREGRYPTEQEMLSMSAAAIQKIWTGQKRGLGGKVDLPLYEASVQIPAEARRQIRAELLRAGHKPEDITEEMVIQEYHRNDNQAMREASIFNTDSWGYYVE